MNLLLLETCELSGGGTAEAVLSPRHARHVREVLRKETGGTIRIGLRGGPIGTGTILSDGAEGLRLACEWSGAPSPRPRADLVLALPRPKVLKRLWPVLGAVGAGRIDLTNAWKVEKPYFASDALSEEVWRKGLAEGMEQARSTWEPEVRIHKHLRELLEDDIPSREPLACLVADPGPGAEDVFSVAAELKRRGGRACVAIGPEGGWTEAELGLFARLGWKKVSWGDGRILRSDTAAAVFLAAFA